MTPEHTDDKWAAEREHFAKGGKIQFKDKHAREDAPWEDTVTPQWNESCIYRIHPDPLAVVKAHFAKGGRVQCKPRGDGWAWLTWEKPGEPEWDKWGCWRVHPEDLKPDKWAHIKAALDRGEPCETRRWVGNRWTEWEPLFFGFHWNRPDLMDWQFRLVSDKCPTCGSENRLYTRLSDGTHQHQVVKSDRCPNPWHNPPSDAATPETEQKTKTHHAKIYDTGEAKWTHGEVVSWHPNRAPERWLLGPCPRCGTSTSNYGTAYKCNKAYCPNSNFVCGPDPIPSWWNTDVNVKKDGDKWCATREGFVNLQESPVGFGDTPEHAVNDLVKNETTRPSSEPWVPKAGDKANWILSGNLKRVVEIMHPTRPRVYQVLLDAASISFAQEDHLEPYVWQLPDPPAGMQWHRPDGWTAEMLPPGTRPLLMGESVHHGDELLCGPGWVAQIIVFGPIPFNQVFSAASRYRTRRPLPAPTPPPPQPEPQPPTAAQTAGEAAYNEYWKSGSEPLPFSRVRDDLRIEWERTAQAAIAFASQSGGEMPSVEVLAATVREYLVSVYHCSRVWSAWSVGTMGQDDFQEATESELAEEIATAVREACMKATKAAQQQHADLSSDASHEVSQAIARAESAEAKAKSHEDELETAYEFLRKRDAAIADLSKKLDSAGHEIADLLSQRNSKEQAIGELRKGLADEWEYSKARTAELETARQSIAELQKEIANLRNGNIPYKDADPRITVQHDDGGWYSWKVGGCLTAPCATWREAYRHAEGYLMQCERDEARQALAELQKEIEKEREHIAESARIYSESREDLRQAEIRYGREVAELTTQRDAAVKLRIQAEKERDEAKTKGLNDMPSGDMVDILRALNAAGAPTTNTGDGSELSIAQRIGWLHTAKGVTDARLAAIQKILTEQRDEARERIKVVERELASLRQSQSGGWIACSERMPTKEDGDEDGDLLWMDGTCGMVKMAEWYQRPDADYTYWMRVPPLLSKPKYKEREEFERAHADWNLLRRTDSLSDYADSHTAAAWSGWQAARAQGKEGQP